MGKYKANKDFGKLKNKYFGIHKYNRLLNGEVIEITTVEDIPNDHKKYLDEVKKEAKK